MANLPAGATASNISFLARSDQGGRLDGVQCIVHKGYAYVGHMFSDGFTFGFPPRDYALNAYREMLREYAPAAPWIIAGLLVDLAPILEQAVAAGGHVRTGIEDAPSGSERGNVELVRAAAAAIRRGGGALGTAAEVRAALAAA